MPRRRRRHFERVRGFTSLTGRRSPGGYCRFGATASAARIMVSHINDSRVDSSNAMRAAHAVAPNLAYPPQWRLPTTDAMPLARSKCRRRRRGAPPCRRHARGGGRFLSCCHCVTATGHGLARPSVSKRVDISRIEGPLTQKLYRNGCIISKKRRKGH